MRRYQPPPGLDVYPVGWLHTWMMAWPVFTRPGRFRDAPGVDLAEVRRAALARIRYEARLTARRIRDRDWRAVKNSLNGYLAEPDTFPANMRRCGTGWTPRRAVRSARRHGWPG